MKKIRHFKFYLAFLVLTAIIITGSQAQETLELPESLTDEELELLGRHDHRRHARGGFPNADKYITRISTERPSRHDFVKYMDQAWTVMLYKQGIITLDEAQTVLSALEKMDRGGESRLTSFLDGDEYHGSIPQIGRTLQEPMARMAVRAKQLDFIEATHAFLNELQNAIERHSETIMPGMTHMSHSQPITYGAYLIAFHDELLRGLEYLELAYKHTNLNSGGCGATSGTGWPVDRYLVTELLGFDELLEPTYAGEAAQEWGMSTLFGLSNMMLTISRVAMDHGIWGMDSYNTHEVAQGHLGLSSLMPQKAHSGSQWERVRIAGNNTIGATMTGLLGLHGEPYQDVLTSYQASYRTPTHGAIGALSEAEALMINLEDVFKTMWVDKEKLFNKTRDGWGCTPDLAIKLIREKGYGPRQAHRISAVTVRIARDHRKIKPYELTGAMVDEAARISNDPEPHLTTEEVREIFDPVKFLERHNNTGDPNPRETMRMLKIRRNHLKEAKHQQVLRRERVEMGYNKLRTEIENIIGN